MAATNGLNPEPSDQHKVCVGRVVRTTIAIFTELFASHYREQK
jgi:hypothetical protein